MFSDDSGPIWGTWNIESNAKEFYQIHAYYWLELLVYRKYLFGSECTAGYQKDSRWYRRIGQFQEAILDDSLRYGSKYHLQFRLKIFSCQNHVIESVIDSYKAEGSRFTKAKHGASEEIAKSKNYKSLKHHLQPRPTGFVTVVEQLRQNKVQIDYLYYVIYVT